MAQLPCSEGWSGKQAPAKPAKKIRKVCRWQKKKASWHRLPTDNQTLQWKIPVNAGFANKWFEGFPLPRLTTRGYSHIGLINFRCRRRCDLPNGLMVASHKLVGFDIQLVLCALSYTYYTLSVSLEDFGSRKHLWCSSRKHLFGKFAWIPKDVPRWPRNSWGLLIGLKFYNNLISYESYASYARWILYELIMIYHII